MSSLRSRNIVHASVWSRSKPRRDTSDPAGATDGEIETTGEGGVFAQSEKPLKTIRDPTSGGMIFSVYWKQLSRIFLVGKKNSQGRRTQVDQQEAMTTGSNTYRVIPRHKRWVLQKSNNLYLGKTVCHRNMRTDGVD